MKLSESSIQEAENYFLKKLLNSVAYRPYYVWKYNSQNISCKKTKRKEKKEMESTFETLTSRAWLTNVVERRTGVEEVAGSSSRPGQHSGS